MGKKLTCDPEVMMGYYLMLADIVQNLDEAYNSAGTLLETFSEGFEGEAKEEITMFLSSLPLHICRLELFYSKLMSFLTVTVETFIQNDTKMTENMEK